MARIKRGTTTRARHKKMFAQTAGYKHGRKNIFRLAKQAWIKAGQYAYRDRRNKKRSLRSQWIIVINAGVREFDMSYSRFMAGLKAMKLDLNRKVLSQLAQQEPEKFKELVEKSKQGIEKLVKEGSVKVEKTLETAKVAVEGAKEAVKEEKTKEAAKPKAEKKEAAPKAKAKPKAAPKVKTSK